MLNFHFILFYSCVSFKGHKTKSNVYLTNRYTKQTNIANTHTQHTQIQDQMSSTSTSVSYISRKKAVIFFVLQKLEYKAKQNKINNNNNNYEKTKWNQKMKIMLIFTIQCYDSLWHSNANFWIDRWARNRGWPPPLWTASESNWWTLKIDVFDNRQWR